MKKLFTLLLTCMIGTMTSWAEDTALDPVGVFTWTNTPAITYDATATSWAINQGGVTSGKIGRYAGPYAIVKFDASNILNEKTLLTATLDFDITAGAYNSSINIAQLSSATFTPSTVTTDNFDATATQFQAGDWSTKNTTIHFSYDVKDRVAAANVIAFAIYTNTAREQTLKNVKLNLQYSAEEVAKYNYTLKAVNANDTEIKTLASGEEYETNTVTVYFPYMFENEGTLYTTTQTPYSVTLSKDQTSNEVTYTEASSDIVAYKEGEQATANTGENNAYSNGKTGYSAGNVTTALATLPAGKYTATIFLVSNPNRSIVIRNTANTDVTTNTIVSLPITKTSAAGVYTSDEFILAEETSVGFSGYTSGTKTNQSADIDYIYITKTGDIEQITINSTGVSSYVTTYALDFSEVEGLTALVATEETQTEIKMEKVTEVPAGTPIIVRGTPGEKYTVPAGTCTALAKTNLLKGFTNQEFNVGTDATNTVYALKNTDGAFHKVATTVTIPAKIAFLESQFATTTEAKAMTIVGEEEYTTAITITTESEAKQPAKLYNAAGQQVDANYNGIVIDENGNKYIK